MSEWKHCMAAAIKHSAENSNFPAALTNELLRRIDTDALTAALALRLALKVPSTMLPQPLRRALCVWMAQEPHRAALIVNSAIQLGLASVSDPQIDKDPTSLTFTARIDLAVHSGAHDKGEGQGQKMQAAEQRALVQALSDHLGVDELVEAECTQDSSTSNPSRKPLDADLGIQCVVSVSIKGGASWSGSGEGSSKQQAKALASAATLSRIADETPGLYG